MIITLAVSFSVSDSLDKEIPSKLLNSNSGAASSTTEIGRKTVCLIEIADKVVRLIFLKKSYIFKIFYNNYF
jgi:hypothetical protein